MPSWPLNFLFIGVVTHRPYTDGKQWIQKAILRDKMLVNQHKIQNIIIKQSNIVLDIPS